MPLNEPGENDEAALKVIADIRTRTPIGEGADAPLIDAWQRMIDVHAVWEGTGDDVADQLCDIYSYTKDVITRATAHTATGRAIKLRLIMAVMCDDGDHTIWDALLAGRMPEAEPVKNINGEALWYFLKQTEAEAQMAPAAGVVALERAATRISRETTRKIARA